MQDDNEIIPVRPTPLPDYPRPLSLLWKLRKDLLSIWPESAYEEQFFGGPVMRQPMYVANSPDTVEHVLVRNNDIYQRKSPYMRKALQPLLGDGLFASDGATWRNRRSIEQPAFQSSHLKRYAAVMTDVAERTCGRWQAELAGRETRILPEMAWLTAEIVSRAMFDYPLGLERVQKIVDGFAGFQASVEQFDPAVFFGWPDWLPGMPQRRQARYQAGKIHRITDEIIEAGRRGLDNHSSLLSLLLSAHADDGLNLEQVRNEMVVILMAGHETTANSLAWAIYLIAQSPRVEQRLLNELKTVLNGRSAGFDDVPALKYTRAIFEEAMRLYPPVPVLSREALADDRIRDREIPKGAIMLVIPWLLHRHRALWERPDHFIPERFMPEWPTRQQKYAYIPFSAGPRICLGAAFGMMEAIICLATIMQRFSIRPAGKNAGYECRLTLRPANGLPMIVQARQ